MLKCQLVSLCMINHSSDLWNLTETNKATDKAIAYCLVLALTEVIEECLIIRTFIFGSAKYRQISMTFLIGGGSQ